MTTIRVTMTETVTYGAEYDLDDFGSMVGLDRAEDESDVNYADRLRARWTDDGSETYGVGDADDLLDDIVNVKPGQTCTVSDRSWQFDVEGLLDPAQAAVRAPAYEPEF